MSVDPTPASDPAKTIVLIHGLWLNPLSWEHWVERYSARGYTVIAPAWPGMDASVEDFRKDPSPAYGVGVAAVTDHYAEIISALDQPPIIIGHSFGGLIVERLLDRGLPSGGGALG